MEIGNYIREQLRQNKRSIRWLSSELGVNEKTLQYKLRKNRLSAIELLQIVRILKINIADLITYAS